MSHALSDPDRVGSARAPRPRVEGKFLFVGDEKFYVRGATYGTFAPGPDKELYPARETVEDDFALMAASGINTVRTYTPPPRWLLDTAARHGLRVMIGLPWEQHVTFLDSFSQARAIVRRVREGVRACAGHPAVLCYAVGNEIPSSIVRWHGRRRIQRWIERLYRAAKKEDPGGLVTYVNYPTTEYLELPFLDLVCFNVYLERRESYEAYLLRLQNIAGDRPLVMAEVGLDTERNGEEAQTSFIDNQIRSTFAAGCAGVFVFAWTDEWHRGGHEVEDWSFGLTRRDRSAKPALAAAARAFAEVPFPPAAAPPRISVVVCTYNGSRHLRRCLTGLSELEYPDYEVIVVNDGSTDSSEQIAREFDVNLISTPNRGLSAARNTGMETATGEIVAYIDDDAYPDRQWLTYLAETFRRTTHVAVGGPNVAPPGSGFVAECVARAPGGPIHVLLTDEMAEHIPGCNMAFRKEALEKVGGFDARFRVAGDDVDLCWRLQQHGGTLGFSPGAMVWHHARGAVSTFWRQQKGYGKAEAMLEMKWPERYNALGHPMWEGRVYGNGRSLFRRSRVYQGVWGSAPFQSIYEQAPGTMLSLTLMPEWYLILAGLLIVAGLGALWTPLLFAIPLLALAIGLPTAQALINVRHTAFEDRPRSFGHRFRLRALTTWLHLMQPLARLTGRLVHGLTPWRQRCSPRFRFPWKRSFKIWSECWKNSDERLAALEWALRDRGAVVMRGGDYDRWDLQVWGGLLGGVRARLAVEDHGGGRQQLRLRYWPKLSTPTLVITIVFVALSAAALAGGAWFTGSLLGAVTMLLGLRQLSDCGSAMALCVQAMRESQPVPADVKGRAGAPPRGSELLALARENPIRAGRGD